MGNEDSGSGRLAGPGRDGDDMREDPIAELIRAAGRGPAASSDARARIHAAVESAWRRTLERPAGDGDMHGPEPQPVPPGRARDARPGTEHRALRRRRSTASTPHSPARRRVLWLATAAAVAAAALLTLDIERAPAPDSEPAVASVARIEGTIRLLRDGSERRLGPDAASTSIRAGDALRTASGTSAAVDLDAGIVLRVAAASAVRFTSADRLDVERGTVYLDTGIDGSGAELEVATPLGSVQHVGTQYEVHVADRTLRVRVREGAVAVRGRSGDLVSESGEQLLIRDDGEAVRTPLPRHDPAWRWVEELAVVRGADEQRLGDLLRWVTRETGRELRFEGPDAEREAETSTLHGVAGLTPNEVLDVIAETTSLEYRDTDGILLVASRRATR